MSVEIVPIDGMPEVAPGDDLPGLIAECLGRSGLTLLDGDIVVVTQKVVSKAEGRIVPEGPEGKAGWIASETMRLVARRGDVVIAETSHGFVCANAGVDASNVAAGFLALLPEDPDASAERLRSALEAATGASLGLIVTDTFGRAWRVGLVNVAIGCAGLPALIDLRGTTDALGRELEVTIEALADEVAAAAGLVMGKAEGVPAAIVRGLRTGAQPLPASALVRPPQDDLFRESPLQAIRARRSVRRFGSGAVPRDALQEAVRAACAAPSADRSRPWLFVVLESGQARKRVLTAMSEAWLADLRRDGVADAEIHRRLATADALTADAPVLIIPCVRSRGRPAGAGARRERAAREALIVSGGAAIQNLMLALHAQGLGSSWAPSSLFCQEETREALGLSSEWIPLGKVAAGRLPHRPDGPLEPPPEVDIAVHMMEPE